MELCLRSRASAVVRRWVTQGTTPCEPLCARVWVKPGPSAFSRPLRAQGRALSSAKPESGLTMLGSGASTRRLGSSLLSGAWDPVPGQNPQTLSGVTVPVLTALLQGFSQNLGEASTVQSPTSGRWPLDDHSHPASKQGAWRGEGNRGEKKGNGGEVGGRNRGAGTT